jgi:hypothetical protein
MPGVLDMLGQDPPRGFQPATRQQFASATCRSGTDLWYLHHTPATGGTDLLRLTLPSPSCLIFSDILP